MLRSRASIVMDNPTFLRLTFCNWSIFKMFVSLMANLQTCTARQLSNHLNFSFLAYRETSTGVLTVTSWTRAIPGTFRSVLMVYRTVSMLPLPYLHRVTVGKKRPTFLRVQKRFQSPANKCTKCNQLSPKAFLNVLFFHQEPSSISVKFLDDL